MPNFIISGGPGAGKTTLLNALHAVGYNTVGEASRVLIQEQVALHSHCLPWVDLPCFARLALRRMIDDYEQVAGQQIDSITFLDRGTPDRVTFFDRGIPDIIAYLRIAGLPVGDPFYQAIRQYPYQPLVFMAPPWEAIYVNDSERWQTFAEATALHVALIDTYQSLGFTVVPLPLTTVTERVTFIRQQIDPLRLSSEYSPVVEPPPKISRSLS